MARWIMRRSGRRARAGPAVRRQAERRRADAADDDGADVQRRRGGARERVAARHGCRQGADAWRRRRPSDRRPGPAAPAIRTSGASIRIDHDGAVCAALLEHARAQQGERRGRLVVPAPGISSRVSSRLGAKTSSVADQREQACRVARRANASLVSTTTGTPCAVRALGPWRGSASNGSAAGNDPSGVRRIAVGSGGASASVRSHQPLSS